MVNPTPAFCGSAIMERTIKSDLERLTTSGSCNTKIDEKKQKFPLKDLVERYSVKLRQSIIKFMIYQIDKQSDGNFIQPDSVDKQQIAHGAVFYDTSSKIFQ